MGKKATLIAVPFVKMHGAGNDYVYIEAVTSPLDDRVSDDLPALARAISDRHFGVGGDGLVVILPSETADFRMRMFNADGSEAQMCGNASRCVAKLIHDKGLSHSDSISLETLAGVKILHLTLSDDNDVAEVTVDMGLPTVDPQNVPAIPTAILPVPECEGTGFSVLKDSYDFGISLLSHADVSCNAVAVSMGNPHGVIYDQPLSDFTVLECGKAFEVDPAWPEKANIEFVKVLAPDHVEMRVWERGSGETMACGTGACAVAVAGLLTGRTTLPLTLTLPGGTLRVDADPATGHILLIGPATTVAEGVYFFTPDAV